MIRYLRVTVDGRTYDVSVETADSAAPAAAPAPVAAPRPVAAAPVAPPPPPPPPAPAAPAAGAHDITSPLAGRLVSFEVKVGDSVEVGAQVATLEAMKMHTTVHAEYAGTVKALLAQPGDAVEEGRPLLSLG